MNAFALMATLGLDSSAYDSGLNKAKSAGSALGKGLATAAKVGITAVGTAATAVTAFGVASVKTGMDFDKSMSQVAATMGKTSEEMQNEVGSVDLAWGKFSGNLREYAQEMGKNTAFSATEAADALNYMALAGYDTQTSMEMLPNVLNLAAAGDMELAHASDMVTDTQTAFGISLERTSQMVDEMAKAASTGNTSVEQLGDAFLTVGGLAQELNGGMVTLADGTQKPVDGVQELEIALTAMANAGVKGSEAGTHMRNMLLKLSDPTDDGVAALKSMGVAVFDTEGKMRSLSAIFGDLSTQMANMTQEEKISTIADLFNTRDIASAEALLNAVSQDWDKIGESILDAEGAAQKMADTQLDNLAGDVTLFKSALEGAKIAVSDQLSPSLREFVQFGTDGLSKLTDAFQKGGLSGAMEAFGQILSDGLNMIISKLPQFVDAGMKLLSALGQGILDNLDTILDAAEKIIIQLLEGLVKALPKIVDGAIKIVVELANFITENLDTLIPAAIDTILAIVDALIDNLDLLIDAAIALIVGLAEGLVDALPKLIEKAPVIIEKLVIALANNAPKLVEAAVKIIVALVGGIVNNLPKILQAARDIIDALIKGIGQYVSRCIEAAKNIMTTIGDAISNWDAAKWGKDMIDSFVQGIKNRISAVKDAVGSVAKTVKDILGFSEPEEGPLSNFHTFAPDMMDLFIQGVRDNTSKLQDQIEKSFDFGSSIVDASNTIPVQTATTESGNIESILMKYLPDLANMKIVLNTGELVGATAGAYDVALGSISNRGARR